MQQTHGGDGLMEPEDTEPCIVTGNEPCATSTISSRAGSPGAQLPSLVAH